MRSQNKALSSERYSSGNKLHKNNSIIDTLCYGRTERFTLQPRAVKVSLYHAFCEQGWKVLGAFHPIYIHEKLYITEDIQIFVGFSLGTYGWPTNPINVIAFSLLFGGQIVFTVKGLQFVKMTTADYCEGTAMWPTFSADGVVIIRAIEHVEGCT